MATKRRSLNLNATIDEIAKRKMAENGYTSFNIYVASLILYDGMVQGEHRITKKWAGMSPEQREALAVEVLAAVEKGKAPRGQFLKRLLDGTSNQA